MAIKNFDEKFQEFFTAMVEIAFEFVNRNKDDIDQIYVFGSTEDNCQFYNVFYQVNGQLAKINSLNEFSNEKFDLSRQRSFLLLELGIDYLEKTAKLFEADDREVPTLMKMTYNPKTGAFSNDISYEPHFSNHPERTEVDGFNEWFESIRSSL